MFRRILFVCTGNICRSAMAEGMLRSMVAAPMEVASAGTGALLGHPADDNVLELLDARGIDVSTHRARQANREILRWADLILGMEKHHIRGVHDIDPTTRGKSFLVGHWLDQFEVDDPYKQGRAAFERTLAELDEALASWLPKLK